jgi:hypothetical protein
MRTWARAVAEAAGHVGDRPELWLTGGLGWIVSVGWIAFIVGVARAPTLADLTFLGTSFYTSAAWPWNAVAVVGALLAAVLAGVLLFAAAEVVLLRRSRATGSDALRSSAVTLVCGLPTVALLVWLVGALSEIAVDEFNAPGGDGGGPIARMALRVAPLIVGVLLAAAAGAAVHAAATRRLVAGASVVGALGAAPRTLRMAGSAAAAQAIGVQVTRLVYLGVAAVLLRVLWSPVAERLGVAGIEPTTLLLLLGFVAIWLCVVLGGGALHATGSAAWTRVLRAVIDEPMAGPQRMETSPHR